MSAHSTIHTRGETDITVSLPRYISVILKRSAIVERESRAYRGAAGIVGCNYGRCAQQEHRYQAHATLPTTADEGAVEVHHNYHVGGNERGSTRISG
jgi:hypothetical protein